MSKKQSQQGFTLIEIVITIGILVMMLVFLVFSASTMRLVRLHQNKDIVVRVVSQKMESLRALGYSGATSGSFTDTQLNTLNKVSASTTITDYNAKIKQVIVGVSWLDSGSTTQYLSATTLLVNSGGL